MTAPRLAVRGSLVLRERDMGPGSEQEEQEEESSHGIPFSARAA